jgi:hypothetical protein
MQDSNARFNTARVQVKLNYIKLKCVTEDLP